MSNVPATATRPAADSRLNALLDAAVDAIILISARGAVTRFNPAAERMFGYTQSEVLGRNVSMLMPEPYCSHHDSYMDRYVRTGEARIIGIGREVVGRRRDGTTFALDLAVGEFRRPETAGDRREHGADEHGFVGILRDITERKAAMRETEDLRGRLAHVGRIGTLGEMVSGIAHEVNQPLTAIANYASACRRLVAGGQIQGEELAGTLEKISAQAERAGQVIRGLRNLVRRRDEVREPLEISTLITEVSRLVDYEAQQGGLHLVLKLAPKLPRVLGDAVQIQQVVLNLIRNGLDAMLESRHGDQIEVATWADGESHVLIRVTDSGPGIAPEVLDRLFEPFFTTKAQGFGLGLSICNSIITAHRGTLSHARAPSGGAAFTIQLPVTT